MLGYFQLLLFTSSYEKNAQFENKISADFGQNGKPFD